MILKTIRSKKAFKVIGAVLLFPWTLVGVGGYYIVRFAEYVFHMFGTCTGIH